jgi:HD superfamily phosphodiesterase
MDTNLLLLDIAGYIQELFRSCYRPYLVYHNFDHTRNVVLHAREIGTYYKLSERSLFVLQAAAWFHDTGQLSGEVTVHEETGVQFMKDFLSARATDKILQDEIAGVIMATKMPVSPASLLEEIICDADTWHLGTKDFRQLDAMVWHELELRFNKPVENQVKRSLDFLLAHRFYTPYCKEVLTPEKNKNIQLLRDILQKEQ